MAVAWADSDLFGSAHCNDLNKLPKVLHDPTKGIAPELSSCCLIGRQWSAKGAQEFPFGVVVADWSTIGAALNAPIIVYIGEPMENQLAFFLA